MKNFIISLSLLALPACSLGNFQAIHKKSEIGPKTANSDQPMGVFVDAEQRAVLSNAEDPSRIVCAEPAPDALSAIAASAGLSVSDLSQSIALQGSTSETAANIGLRTQTIQSLRDGYYRICEARMNGMPQVQYSMMLRRFQSNMIALLAIEQLTGAIKGSEAVVSSVAGTPLNMKEVYVQRAASAEIARQRAETQLEDVNKKITAETEAKGVCEKPVPAGGTAPDGCSADEVKARAETIASLESQKTDLEGSRDQAQTVYDANTKLAEDATTPTNSQALGAILSNPVITNQNAAVADAVESIALKVLERDYGLQMCIEYLRVNEAGAVAGPCGEVVQAYADQISEATTARQDALQTAQELQLKKLEIVADVNLAQRDAIDRTLDAIFYDDKISADEKSLLEGILGTGCGAACAQNPGDGAGLAGGGGPKAAVAARASPFDVMRGSSSGVDTSIPATIAPGDEFSMLQNSTGARGTFVMLDSLVPMAGTGTLSFTDGFAEEVEEAVEAVEETMASE